MSVYFEILIPFANFDCMNLGTVWGFSKSQMLIGLVIGENGDEANTSQNIWQFGIIFLLLQ